MARTLGALALLSIAVVVLLSTPATAVDLVSEINSPAHCGDCLKVMAEHTDGKMLRYVVDINPDQAGDAGELYKGRVKVRAHLQIATAEAKVASMLLEPSVRKDETRFEFEIAPGVREHSALSLSTQLYEKDGIPTLGGGRVFVVNLKGFPPTGRSR